MSNLIINPYVFAAAVDAGIALTDNSASSADLSEYTFSTQSFGADTANRTVIVAAVVRASNTGVGFGTVTIGGVTASEAFEYNVDDGGNSAAIGFFTAVLSGTTGDVVVDINLTASRCGIGVWRATDLLSVTPHDTDSAAGTTSAISTSLNILAGGVAVSAAYGNNNDVATWSAGLTEDYDATLETNRHTGASDAFASLQTGLTITVDIAGATIQRMASVSFR